MKQVIIGDSGIGYPYANHWHLIPERQPCQYLIT